MCTKSRGRKIMAPTDSFVYFKLLKAERMLYGHIQFKQFLCFNTCFCQIRLWAHLALNICVTSKIWGNNTKQGQMNSDWSMKDLDWTSRKRCLKHSFTQYPWRPTTGQVYVGTLGFVADFLLFFEKWEPYRLLKSLTFLMKCWFVWDV